MEIVRLVVTGPPGAGKTTFVQTISDTAVISTERSATDAASIGKPKTTVGFDFGRVSFGSQLELHVYGTPGQSRFDFLWDILVRRAHAHLLLVAAHRPNDILKAHQICAFVNQRVQIPLVIGITHLDQAGACHPEEIMLRLGYYSTSQKCPPMIAVNATDQRSVNQALNIIALAFLASRSQSVLSKYSGNSSSYHPSGEKFDTASWSNHV